MKWYSICGVAKSVVHCSMVHVVVTRGVVFLVSFSTVLYLLVRNNCCSGH